MKVAVELYGLARHRVQLASHTVELWGDEASITQVLTQLANDLPALRGDCIQEGRLTPSFTANLAGERFLTADATLHDGDVLLILSADAGG
jgi:molybdopterin converting factor small subunit